MITETNTRQVEPGITVFAITGRLNLGNTLLAVEQSIRKLIADGSRKVVLDLSGLNYLDSAGIGVLIVTISEMERQGGLLRIAGAQGAVAKAFEIVHMKRVAPLYPDVESACRAISDSSGSAST